MAATHNVMAQIKRRGTFLSGSVRVPLEAAEKVLTARANIKDTELEIPATVAFHVEVLDPVTNEWNHIAGATWEGGVGATQPSISMNLLPHKGKRVRMVIDTAASETTVGAVIDLED